MPLRTSIDTTRVQPDDRVRYWEDHCRSNLVGFRCSPYSDQGLLARQTCVDFGPMRVAHTHANAHVIERTPDMIRAFPREAIFVNVVTQGETFVYQRGHCFKVEEGDVLIYDARYPYLVGGAEQFALLHADIPAEIFHSRLARADLNKPIRVGALGSTQRLYNRTLSRLLAGLIQPERDGHGEPRTEAMHIEVCDLLGMMMGLGRPDGEASVGVSALSAGHLLAAKAWIEEHLADEGLRAEQIACAVGISERHLRRLFAGLDTTVADYVQGRRLDRAHEEMRLPACAGMTVAETAYRCGFASQAHFSRLFRQRFGLTPSQWQRQVADRRRAAS